MGDPRRHVELRTQAPQGQLLPGFLEPRRLAEKALTAVIEEAYIQAISTLLGRRSGQAYPELVEGATGMRHLQPRFTR